MKPFPAIPRPPLAALWLSALLLGGAAFAGGADAPAREPLAGAVSGGYPDDPFADDYRRQPATQIGTARGQTRVSALGALVEGNNSADVYLGGQLAVEFMLHEFGGIRLSGFQDTLEANGQSLARKFSSMRAGPALHLRPYRRVDLGPYAAGGLLVVDMVDGKTSQKTAEAVLGGFITVHLDSFVFVQLELERAWAALNNGGNYVPEHRTAAMLGIGVAF